MSTTDASGVDLLLPIKALKIYNGCLLCRLSTPYVRITLDRITATNPTNFEPGKDEIGLFILGAPQVGSRQLREPRRVGSFKSGTSIAVSDALEAEVDAKQALNCLMYLWLYESDSDFVISYFDGVRDTFNQAHEAEVARLLADGHSPLTVVLVAMENIRGRLDSAARTAAAGDNGFVFENDELFHPLPLAFNYPYPNRPGVPDSPLWEPEPQTFDQQTTYARRSGAEYQITYHSSLRTTGRSSSPGQSPGGVLEA